MASKRPIRHHTKAKTGCLECRARKIKCDEEKPTCRKCARRSTRCTYWFLGSSTAPPISLPEFSTPHTERQINNSSRDVQGPSWTVVQNLIAPAISSTPFGLNMLHMELFHHWHTSTCLTVTRSPELQHLWRVEVPRIGLSHNYVLEAILTLSARHLSRIKPNSQEKYDMAAVALQRASLNSVAQILPSVTEENCSALFIFSGVAWMNSMAVPEKPEEIPPLSQTETMADWLVMLRGIKSITMTAWDWLEKGDLGAMLHLANIPMEGYRRGSSADKHLLRLQELFTQPLSSPKKAAIYDAAIEELRSSFITLDNLRNDQCSLRVIFTWPSIISEEYLLLLGRREPKALVIFAFFAVLLSKLEYCWWLNGWAKHLISRISDMLDPCHRLWIRWPIEIVNLQLV